MRYPLATFPLAKAELLQQHFLSSYTTYFLFLRTISVHLGRLRFARACFHLTSCTRVLMTLMVVLSAKSCFICIAWSRTIPGCIVFFSHYLSLICMSYSYRIPLYKYNPMHVSTFWSSYFAWRSRGSHAEITNIKISTNLRPHLYHFLQYYQFTQYLRDANTECIRELLSLQKLRFFIRSIPNRAAILPSKDSPPPTVPHRCSAFCTPMTGFRFGPPRKASVDLSAQWTTRRGKALPSRVTRAKKGQIDDAENL
jgi:hypothetical protein